MPTSLFACRTVCTNPCTYSTVYATTSSLPPRPSYSSSTRRTFLRKRSRKSISAFASQITMVSRFALPPRNPPNQSPAGSHMVPTQRLEFGLCWDQVKSLEVGAEERTDVALGRCLEGLKWDKMSFFFLNYFARCSCHPALLLLLFLLQREISDLALKNKP